MEHIVDLSKQKFNAVKVTLDKGKTNETHYTLKTGDIITDEKIYNAFPQYFSDGLNFVEEIQLTFKDKMKLAYKKLMSNDIKVLVATILFASFGLMFDFEGWRSTWSDTNDVQIVFMIITFYYGKYILISLISESDVITLVNLVRKFLMSVLLLGLVFISVIGIHNSLSKSMYKQTFVNEFVDTTIMDNNTQIREITQNINIINTNLKALPTNYNMLSNQAINDINYVRSREVKKITKLSSKIEALRIEIKKINSNKFNTIKSSETNAITYTANVIGINERKLIRIIIYTLIFVLEIGYLVFSFEYSRRGQKISST